jgi:integrase
MSLGWDDLDTRWRGLTIRGKVEGERVTPLTPYVHHLTDALEAWLWRPAKLVHRAKAPATGG